MAESPLRSRLGRRRRRGGAWANATRLTVRPHVPLPVRLAVLTVALLLSAALAAVWTWRSVVAEPEAHRAHLVAAIDKLRAELDAVTAERDRLSNIALAADSRVTIERTASEQIARQLRVLEAENARLKADIAFFETVLPADTGGTGVSIRRFVIEPDDAPDRLRFRALVMESSRGDREFAGQLQLVVHGAVAGKPASVALPADDDAELKERLQLSFRRYLRVEGSFGIPPGIVVKSVQLRVIERGAVRAQQSATL